MYPSTLLQVEFDPILLLPTDSYLRRFYDLREVDFPIEGWAAKVLMGEMGHGREEIEGLDYLVTKMDELAKEEEVRVDRYQILGSLIMDLGGVA